MANDYVTPQSQHATIIVLGRYHLLRQIGRGGMGEVWLGKDPRLNRQVAIKTLPVRGGADREFSQRFEREARAAAALNHPHILPVHDYGEQISPDGQVISYIVMPYISGGSLAERIASLKASNAFMPQDEAINYLSQAAEAIDYAHTQGILHRDIKPANMLLRNTNWLLLTDFGIARILSDREHLTQTGAGFGTPEYMPPEQAQGKAEAASDNYSLAVIAYQLFTGQLPFMADTAYAIAMQHILMPPPAPRQINPKLSPAVEQVLLCGLAKEPTQRYQSAHAFVAELQRGLAGITFEPMVVRQPLPPGDVPFTANDGQKLQQSESLPLANDNKGTVSATGITRRQVLTGGAAALVALGGLGTWAIISRSHKSQPGRATTPTHKTMRRAIANPGIMTLLAHNKSITSLAWSPTANILASAGLDNQVILWDFQDMQQGQASPKAKQQFDTGVNMLLAWAPDGKMIAIGNGATDSKSLNGIVLVYTGDLRSPVPGYNNILSFPFLDALAWAPGKYLVAATTPIASHQSRLEVWDPAQPTQLLGPIKLSNSVSSSSYVTPNTMAFAPDGSMLAIGLDDGVLIGQLSVSGKKVRWQPRLPLLKFDQFSSPGDAVSWSSNGQYVAALSVSAISGHTLAIWDWKTGDRTLLSTPSDTNTPLTALAWSPAPTSTLLAVSDKDGVVYVWNISSSGGNTLPIQTFPGINAEVLALAWSMDGKWLAAGYNDVNDSILVFSVPSGGS